MQRYFTKQKQDNHFLLSSEDSYHIKIVMRMKTGDKVEVIYNSECYLCEIINLENLVSVTILKKQEEVNELNFQVTIVQSLVKEQKMDYILQKVTELGVNEIIPYESERSIVKIDGKMDKKIERWQKIVKEAAEQSKRTVIPKIRPVMDLSNLVNLIDFDMKFLCTVNEKNENLKKVLSNLREGARMLFVIGPEGGFTEKEETDLIAQDFIPVSLGDSVLRTETASTFIMSVVRFLDMK